MKLIFDEEQELLATTARQWVDSTAPLDRLRELRDAKDPVGFSREVWKQMAALGWTGMCLPEEYGGSGLGFAELAIVLEETGRRLLPEPLLSTVLLGAQALLFGGTRTQKERYLPRVSSGDAVLTVAYDERGSRSELGQIATVAERSAGGFRLSGEKVHVLDAHVAEALLVSARVGQSARRAATANETGENLVLFLVDPRAKGVTRTPQARIDSRNAAHVRLDGVEVTEDDIVGGMDQGLSLLSRVIDRATVGLSAEMLGAASQAFDDTLLYLKTRKQFGVTIGSFQALQHRAARLFIELALARSAVLAAARTADADSAALPKMASLAKARATDAFLHVANEAIQMHGGIGVTDEFHLGFYIKRARAAAVTFGDAAWHRRRWAALSGY